MGIKGVSIRLRFEEVSWAGGSEWAVLQRTWKRALFHIASRSVGPEQNACRDLDITSEFPSLMSLPPQKPFPMAPTPQECGCSEQEKPSASVGHLLAPHLVDGVSLSVPCPAGMAGPGNTTAR